jgi:peptide-methionine (R)-S-oxide reductase
MIYKTIDEWREILTPEQFRVCCLGEMEPEFSGQYLHHNEAGRYICICCGDPLFDSRHKFDAGTGWASFWQTYAVASVILAKQARFGTPEYENALTKVYCFQCNAHIGCLFKEGPQPTRLRYSINSISIKFLAKKLEFEKKPQTKGEHYA